MRNINYLPDTLCKNTPLMAIITMIKAYFGELDSVEFLNDFKHAALSILFNKPQRTVFESNPKVSLDTLVRSEMSCTIERATETSFRVFLTQRDGGQLGYFIISTLHSAATLDRISDERFFKVVPMSIVMYPSPEVVAANETPAIAMIPNPLIIKGTIDATLAALVEKLDRRMSRNAFDAGIIATIQHIEHRRKSVPNSCNMFRDDYVCTVVRSDSNNFKLRLADKADIGIGYFILPTSVYLDSETFTGECLNAMLVDQPTVKAEITALASSCNMLPETDFYVSSNSLGPINEFIDSLEDFIFKDGQRELLKTFQAYLYTQSVCVDELEYHAHFIVGENRRIASSTIDPASNIRITVSNKKGALITYYEATVSV